MKLLSTIVPYLLLVSFFTGDLQNYSNNKAGVLNISPYNGTAVRLIGAYDTSIVSSSSFIAEVNRLKLSSTKHIWPWIFFNRFYGYDPNERSLSSASNTDYFLKIKGMDIYNETGALNDFYNIWTISLTIAKDLQSPGIFVDMEAYNNYKIYSLSYLSEKLGRNVEDVKYQLKSVGAKLIDIADNVYPTAELWFAFTGLGTLNATGTEKDFMTVTYIVQGMLERSKIKESKLKFISGGSLSLGYCYKSITDLNDKINTRNINHGNVLHAYSNYFLGGTIAPWHDAAAKKEGFFTKGNCAENNLNNLDDFRPLLSVLFGSYRYNFIYAAMDVGYNPYDTYISSKYNSVINEALSNPRRLEAPQLYNK